MDIPPPPSTATSRKRRASYYRKIHNTVIALQRLQEYERMERDMDQLTADLDVLDEAGAPAPPEAATTDIAKNSNREKLPSLAEDGTSNAEP